MRQNIALLLIAVVVLAGAAGILAMITFNNTNNTTNMSLNISNNTTPNNTINNTKTQKTSSSKDSNDNDNGSNVNNGGNTPSGEGHWETCPTCGGARFIQDPSDPHGDSIICPTCHGNGRIWVSD